MRHLLPEIAKWHLVPERQPRPLAETFDRLVFGEQSQELRRKDEGKSDNAETAVLAGGCFLDMQQLPCAIESPWRCHESLSVVSSSAQTSRRNP
jgi:hypothetical protein